MTTPTRLLAMIGAAVTLLYAFVALPAPSAASLAARAQATRAPLDLVVVLDASGSMNWTWDGYGTMGVNTASEGVLTQFQPPEARGAGYPIRCNLPEILALPKGCQSADRWSTYQERRLYEAKQAVKVFLEQFPWQPGDRAALVTFNGQYFPPDPTNPVGLPPDEAMARFTAVYSSTGLTTNILAGTNSVAELLINQAASRSPGSSDPEQLYTTLGASPGALGLKRAKAVPDGASRRGAPAGDRVLCRWPFERRARWHQDAD